MFDISNNITGIIISSALGAIIGSFLNVCIYRLPLKRPLVFSRSKCPLCAKPLSMLDLVPVISYIIRKGKCRYCREPISSRYPLVEILSGLLFLLCWTKYAFSAQFFITAIFASFLLVITFIDLDWLLIFDKVLVWMVVTVLAFKFLTDSAYLENFSDYLLAAAIGGGFLFAISMFKSEAMGLGDVKLSFTVGLLLGTADVILTLFLAFVFGASAGLILIGLGFKNRKDVIPFAPFISIGAFISMLYGNEIIGWYLKIHGLG